MGEGEEKVVAYLQPTWLEEALPFTCIPCKTAASLLPLRDRGIKTYAAYCYLEVTAIHKCMPQGDFYIYKEQKQTSKQAHKQSKLEDATY